MLGSSGHPWPLSLAAPRSKSLEMGVRGPCTPTAHPYHSG